jgi:hypothetical protein
LDIGCIWGVAGGAVAGAERRCDKINGMAEREMALELGDTVQGGVVPNTNATYAGCPLASL